MLLCVGWMDVIFVAINAGYQEVDEQVDEKGRSILSQEDVTQLIWSPRSQKQSMTMVAMGSFCNTSSSFKDFPFRSRQKDVLH